MQPIDRHPPADRRCQIYTGSTELFRCRNEGTHWEQWGSEGCIDDDDCCEADFFSWECDGDHDVPEALSA